MSNLRAVVEAALSIFRTKREPVLELWGHLEEKSLAHRQLRQSPQFQAMHDVSLEAAERFQRLAHATTNKGCGARSASELKNQVT